jgi:glutamate N-acetyltransferase/amino-acid N-acetyltransferase
MKIIKDKTITDISGFKASGISSGLKKSGKKDMGIIYSEKPAVAAAFMTTNKAKAAPILLAIETIKSDFIQAIVINSGNANACTGEEGLVNANKMAEETGNCLAIPKENVIVASTGVIGVQLPMDILLPGIKTACEEISKAGGKDVAQSILTTDTFIKTIGVEVEIGGKTVAISGIAKGSGMIHPNMATMLSFIVTDANISKECLNKIFKESVDDSYNMISVDGDSSTNDMAIVLANGLAENPLIDDSEEYIKEFKEALDYVNQELAKMIAKDGEGATKFIEVSLYNAQSKDAARILARSVVSSNLVKAAIFGSDANWGRIMCALGYAEVDCNLDKLDIYYENAKGKEQVFKNGAGLLFSEEKAKEILDESYINIIVDLNDGNYNAKAWGCDLTYDYVKINGSYRS